MSYKKNVKKEISLNEDQINLFVNTAILGFLLFLENREKEFYKQLSKMRL